MTTPQPAREALEVTTATGTWAVHAAGGTAFYVDADERRVLRERDPAARSQPWDGVWASLDGVTSSDQAEGTVRVGMPTYWLVHAGGIRQSWPQAVCASITPVPADELPVGRAPAPDEGWSAGDGKWDRAR